MGSNAYPERIGRLNRTKPAGLDLLRGSSIRLLIIQLVDFLVKASAYGHHLTFL